MSLLEETARRQQTAEEAVRRYRGNGLNPSGPGAIRIVDGELARIVAESEAALLAAGGVYRRGGVPVHVRRVDDDWLDVLNRRSPA